MSDEGDFQFEQGDSGSAGIEKVQAGCLKMGSLVMIKGHACKVVNFSTAKTGKRGRFTPAQRAKISAGLKAKWAARKAAASATPTPAPAVANAPVGEPTRVDQTIPAGAESVKMVAPTLKT